VTLDFGGAWVTVGDGRDLTSADLTVALDGEVFDSSKVALSRHPVSEGVYNLVFAAESWAQALATENLTVSFAAGAFVSPTHGPLDAFSERVALVDCTLPFVVQAIIMEVSGYECGASCPADGLWRADFVLDINFSKPVFGVDGPVTDADVEIYIVGGVATVADTYLVQRVVGAGQRRLSEAGVTGLSIAVELSAGMTGAEVVKVRANANAIRDQSGAWVDSYQDEAVVTAKGEVINPLTSGPEASASEMIAPIAWGLPLSILGGVLLPLCVCFFYCRRRHRLISIKRRVAPNKRRSEKDLIAKAAPMPRGKPASADALAIAKHYEWLRAREPLVELTARWIDTLADTAVDALRTVQPAYALVPGVLKTAQAVHANLRGRPASDDLEALQSLGHVLCDGPPTPLPESLVMAAASLDTSASAAMGRFGEAEAGEVLQELLASGRPLPKAVALAMGDVAAVPTGYAGEAHAALKQQLADLLQQRECYTYTLASIRGLVPACLDAVSATGEKRRIVATDAGAFALMREMVEMHVRLAWRQRAAEARTGRAIEAPYQAKARLRGFSSLDAAKEVAEASRRVHSQVVAKKLKAAGLVPFSGKLRQGAEPSAASGPLSTPRPPLRRAHSSSSGSAMEVGGFMLRKSARINTTEAPSLLTRKSSTGKDWDPPDRASVRLSEREEEPGDEDGGLRRSTFGDSAQHLVLDMSSPRPGAQ